MFISTTVSPTVCVRCTVYGVRCTVYGVRCTAIPVGITMFEIIWTDLTTKYVQNYMTSTAPQAFKVYFYQYDKCKVC